jgi:hypothetical protein
MPRKCLATTRCIDGTIACIAAKIASKNHENDVKPRVVFKASPIIPIMANRKLRSELTLLAVAYQVK